MITLLKYIASGGKPRNCESILAANITASATTLTITTGDGIKFPSYTPFLIQIEDEIVNCTSKATDTLTIERGKKNTTADSHVSGSPLRAILYSNDLDLDRAVCNENAVVCNENKIVYN